MRDRSGDAAAVRLPLCMAFCKCGPSLKRQENFQKIAALLHSVQDGWIHCENFGLVSYFLQQWSQWSIVLTGNQTATIYSKTYIIINNLIDSQLDDNRCPLVVRAAAVSPEVQFNGQPFDLPRSAQYAV